MEWRAPGLLLAVRRHGEAAAIIEVFTEAHGRHAGIVRGGASRRMAPLLQVGAALDVTWKARLAEHLGTMTVEPLKSRAGMMADPETLAGLTSLTALASFALPERQAYPGFYGETQALVALMEAGVWQPEYIGWELSLLRTLGFGLEIERSTLSGETQDLAYVSPKTGRAVTAAEGAAYADKLLRLPPFLRQDAGERAITAGDLQDGLRLTGHFLSTRLAPALGKNGLPPARERLTRAFARL